MNVISDRNFNLYEEIKNARRSKNEELFTEGNLLYVNYSSIEMKYIILLYIIQNTLLLTLVT